MLTSGLSLILDDHFVTQGQPDATLGLAPHHCNQAVSLKTFHSLLRASLQDVQNCPPPSPLYSLPWSEELRLSALKKMRNLTTLFL